MRGIVRDNGRSPLAMRHLLCPPLAVRTAVVHRAEAAKARLVADTRNKLKDATSRHLTLQLEECERLPEAEIAPAMCKVALACVEQVPDARNYPFQIPWNVIHWSCSGAVRPRRPDRMLTTGLASCGRWMRGSAS